MTVEGGRNDVCSSHHADVPNQGPRIPCIGHAEGLLGARSHSNLLTGPGSFFSVPVEAAVPQPAQAFPDRS